MASLRKFPRSPYWYACFSLPDGRRIQRSTEETKRKDAQAKADSWEAIAKEGAKARRAQQVIAEIYRTIRGEDLPDSTPRAFLKGWLARKGGEWAETTRKAYATACEGFTAWLENYADRPLAELEARHFIGYRDHIAETRSAATANQRIKILRVAFEDARRDGFISENPAKDAGTLKRAKARSRRPFTTDEIRRILSAADDEMRSLVLFGLYTGQRLGDLASLTWANVDTQTREISLVTAKTGRTVKIPIAQPLMDHIESLHAGDNPRAFLHPRAAASSGPANSNRFGDLLASIGLVESRRHTSKDKGRDARRAPSELSFHSLRHTATSLMKNAGISPAIVQDIIGHESAEISAHYTHVEHSAKAQALAALPDFTARPS